MRFNISYDENDKPYHVNTDDGFMEISRPFDKEEDGWMEEVVDPTEFLSVRLGRETEYLVARVNQLAKENWKLKHEVKMWMRAAGYYGSET